MNCPEKPVGSGDVSSYGAVLPSHYMPQTPERLLPDEYLWVEPDTIGDENHLPNIFVTSDQRLWLRAKQTFSSEEVSSPSDVHGQVCLMKVWALPDEKQGLQEYLIADVRHCCDGQFVEIDADLASGEDETHTALFEGGAAVRVLGVIILEEQDLREYEAAEEDICVPSGKLCGPLFLQDALARLRDVSDEAQRDALEGSCTETEQYEDETGEEIPRKIGAQVLFIAPTPHS
jgi:hypothetical protein